ncbi:MAG: NAD(P)H-binding protein [Nitrososphaerales archaeon]
MTRITVFGATGGTGKQLVKQALSAGYEVVAYARDRARTSALGPHGRLANKPSARLKGPPRLFYLSSSPLL